MQIEAEFALASWEALQLGEQEIMKRDKLD